MNSFLDVNKPLYQKKSGFMLMHLVLSSYWSDWYVYIDKDNFTSVTFIDLK